MLIDSHCHLNHPKIASLGTVEQLVANAKAQGVDGMVTISCRIAEEYGTLLSIAHSHENVWCTVGTHPHDAGNDAEKAISLEALVELAQADERIIGIGESGLDYFYNHSPAEDQQQSFRKHIRACIETGLPLVVHARDADADIIRIVREEGAGTDLKGVMHCFSSSPKMGEEALELGFYISLSGMLTFGRSEELRAFAQTVPLDRLLVETDAPFLAPQPFRSAVNQPALVRHTCQRLAELHEVPLETMAAQTTKNFFRLFDKAKLT